MSNRQDLIRKFQELQDRIRTLMEDAVVGSQATQGQGFQSHWSPTADIYETAKEFVLTIEIPGLEQEQIDLQIQGNVLVVRGQRNPCAELSNQVYYRLERPSGSFERRFNLPEAVDADKIRAKLNEGVLAVTLPKKQRRPPFKVEVGKTQKG